MSFLAPIRQIPLYRWLPALTAALVLALGALLIFFLEQYLLSERRGQAMQVSAQKAWQIDRQLHQGLSSTYALAALIKLDDGKIVDFDAVAEHFLPLYPGVSALQLAPAGVIRHVVPLAGNEKAIGHDLLADERRNKEARLAIQTGRLTLAGPFELVQGGHAVIGRLPVYLDEQKRGFWGFTTALIRLGDFLAAVQLDELEEQGYAYELWRSHPDTGERQMFVKSAGQLTSQPVTTSLKVPNGEWFLSVAPTEGWLDASRLAFEALFALLLAAGAGLAVFLYLRTQRALAQSEMRYRTLYESTPTMMHSIDAQGKIVSVSQEWLDTLGYQRDEVLGHHTAEFLAEESRRRAVDSVLPEFYRTGICREVAYQMVCRDGRVLDVLLSACAERDEQGQIVRSLAVIRDVTQRKQAAIKLAESEQRMELALAGASLGMWDWLIQSGKFTCNQRMTEILGYRPGELELDNATYASLINRADLAQVHGTLYRHLKGETPMFEAEYRVRHKDDHWVWVLCRGRIVERDAAGRALRMTGTNLDISERKQNEGAIREREARLDNLISSMQDLVIVFDTGGGVVEYFYPPHGRHPFGSPTHPCGGTYIEQLPQDIAEDFVLAIGQILQEGKPVTLEYTLSVDGAALISAATISPLNDHSDFPQGYLAVVRDVTTERLYQREIEALSRRNTLLLESIGEGIFGVDLDFKTSFVNSAALTMLGLREEEMLGCNQHELFHHRRQDGKPYPASECPVNHTLRDGRHRHSDVEWFWRKDGSGFPVSLHVTPVIENGVQTGAVVAFQDITQRRRAEEEIHHLAFFDPLTQLPNRRLLIDRLKQAVAGSVRSRLHGALFFLDLDNFKSLNDSHGHDAGDLLLQQVAGRLVDSVRNVDTVARLGGDEFVLLLEDLSADRPAAELQAAALARKILAALNQPYPLATGPHQSTPSIGVALFVGNELSVDELLKRADIAMYRAKSAGRNTWRLFEATAGGQ